jgi:glutathione S-transferase
MAMDKTLNNPEKPFRLITIFVSHYCEKVRWALQYLQIPYLEEPHVPPFHRFITQNLGGKSVPLLVTPDGIFTDSTDILKYLDTLAPAHAKLYPSDPKLRQQVEELEDLFNSQLGSCTRRWGYFHALDNYKLIQKRWCEGTPFWEQVLFPVVFPFMQSVVRKSMNINADSATDAYKEINCIFTQVSELLSDGRTYLVGDSFSAADITFAALAAPVVMPPEHTVKPLSLQELPIEMATKIEQFRETPAGAYVLQLFRDKRN